MNVEIINCWPLSSGLVVVEISHPFNGLPQGTLITDNIRSWHIDKRILFNHTSGEQKHFEKETTSSSFLSFKDVEAMTASADHVLANEARGIFQYTLQEKIAIPKGVFTVKHPGLEIIAI